MIRNCENEVKKEFEKIAKRDFFVKREVAGKNLVVGAKVRTDYLIYPRAHLIDNGFPEGYFVVEAKHFKDPRGIDEKLKQLDIKFRKLFLQCISYAQSIYEVKDRSIMPLASLVIWGSDAGYHEQIEKRIEYALYDYYFLNVGAFNIGTEYRINTAYKDPTSWSIKFSSCRMYSSEKGIVTSENYGICRHYGSGGRMMPPTKKNGFMPK